MNMNINNPFQINDWEIRKFLSAVLAIQLAMWGVIGLDVVGLQIPILRQFIGFIYLTFIPGIIIIRILKLHKLGNVGTLLYSIGLSTATLMFTGLSMNLVYPLSGIPGPISLLPLIITISMVVLVLCALSYIRDKEYDDPAFIDLDEVLSPPVLLLCLVPFMAIFGTYLVNFHHNNVLLMLMLAVIAIVALLVAFDRFIPNNLYPLAVFIIALSLLYHRSLISMYIWGWDIHIELYYSNLVMENFKWNMTIPGNVNSMLSVVMLAPIYSNICLMSITWVFKIFYPLLFAFVPLGLYQVFQKQTNDKIAFLSCFFFVSFFTFYTEMLALARQQIAELFLVLLVMLMVDKNIDKAKRSFLFIVFNISLAVSHYGLSYIYMFCLITVWLMLVADENRAVKRLMRKFCFKFSNKIKRTGGNPVHLKVDRKISLTFVLIFVTFAMAWYMFVSSSSVFNAIVKIGDQIAGSIFTDFLNPGAAQGLEIIIREASSPLHSIAKYLHLLFQFFIFVGIAKLILNYKKMDFEREYEAFSLLNFAICVGGIALPYFAGSLNTTRLYQITLIFLAPFCVIGGIAVFKASSRIVNVSWTDQHVKHSLKVLSVFLAIFLLFNSNWVYEVAKDNPNSATLSQNWVREHGDAKTKVGFYGGYDPEHNIVSLNWLSRTINKEDIKSYAGKVHLPQICGYGMIPIKRVRELSNTTNNIDAGAYVYLGYLNIVEGIVVGWGTKSLKETLYYNTTQIYPLLNIINKIYTNGGSEIYYRGEK